MSDYQFATSSGGGTWGSITGTLADQTDLQAALDAKVTGPGSATDNALARFDGTSGKLIQNSVALLTDLGALSGLISAEISGGANDARVHFVNTATGTTSTDGSYVGIGSTGILELRQRENLDLEFFTNNTSRAIIQEHGRFTIGDTTESVTFFSNDSQKFLVAKTETGVGEDLATIIRLSGCSVTDVSPSADTNTGGLGFSAYSTWGANLNLIGSNKFNGGLPLGGLTWGTSAIGAFGQVNIKTDDDVDGCVGTLFSVSHWGNGSAVDYMVGGAFSAETSQDLGTTGSVANAIGGTFNVLLGENGVNITTAASAIFYEPYIHSTGTITNKTAAFISGTLSILESDSSSTGNIDAFSPASSYNYMTGAAPVMRGIAADTYNKVLVFDFLNTCTITNESGAVGTAGNRITTGTGADILLVKSFAVAYNTTTSRWRVVWYRL